MLKMKIRRSDELSEVHLWDQNACDTNHQDRGDSLGTTVPFWVERQGCCKHHPLLLLPTVLGNRTPHHHHMRLKNWGRNYQALESRYPALNLKLLLRPCFLFELHCILSVLPWSISRDSRATYQSNRSQSMLGETEFNLALI